MTDNDFPHGAHVDGQYRDRQFLKRANAQPGDDYNTRINKVLRQEASENYRGPRPSIAHPRLFWILVTLIVIGAVMFVGAVLQH